jgi:hypothetical protein
LCGVQEYASAQFLDFLELAENGVFLDRKLTSAFNETVDGHYLLPVPVVQGTELEFQEQNRP